jgi:hypothetical protein
MLLNPDLRRRTALGICPTRRFPVGRGKLRSMSWLLAASTFGLPPSAYASETTIYAYDALGRLVSTSSSGSVNNGVGTHIDYDPAGNRVNYAVSGSSQSDPSTSATVFSIAAGPPVDEGSNLLFTVTRTGSETTQSISYATFNGSATAGSDYNPVSGTLTFAPGQTSQVVSVATTIDGIEEPAETLAMTLSNPTGGATIGTAQAAGTINASAAPSPPTANQNPVALDDAGGMIKCAATKLFDVVKNDYDPDTNNNQGLVLISIEYNGVLGQATVSGNSVAFTPNGATGEADVTYTIRDPSGARASAILRLNISNSTTCGGAALE